MLDDLHWAEPALLDLVEYLVERLAAPVVLICLARPELLDGRPGWAGAASGVGLLRLGPLGQDEAQALLEGLGEGEVDERVRRRIVERAEGNALHLEQLFTFIADEGGDPGLESVPPTVEAVLASRVDRLSPEVRDTLQRASVAGRELTRGIAVALSEPGAPVDAALLELTRRGLLHSELTEGPDDAYSIHHALLRDVAYGSLPKAVRAVLHERAAAWLDRDGPGPDELVGWHLEQAYRYRAELRPADPELAGLAEAAGGRLGIAGLRAWWGSDVPATLNLLDRSVLLVPVDAPQRAQLLCELALAQSVAGNSAEAARGFAEALAEAERTGQAAIAARARIESALVDLDLGVIALEEVEQTRLAAVGVLESQADDRGLGRAFMALTLICGYGCRYGAMEEAATRAMTYYQRAGVNAYGPLSARVTALYHGPAPVTEALSRCSRLIAEADDQASRAGAVSALSALTALQGRFDEAAALSDEARRTWEDLSMARALATAWAQRRVTLEWLRGDLAAAEFEAARSLEFLLDRSEMPHASTVALLLSRLQLARGDEAGARRSVEIGAEGARDGDALVNILLLSTRARLLARSGDHEAARTLASDAVAGALSTDALLDRAQAWTALAEIERIAGNEGAAQRAVAEAERLLEEKQAPAFARGMQLLYPALAVA